MTKCLQISLIAEQKQAGQGLNTFSWVICKCQSGNGAQREREREKERERKGPGKYCSNPSVRGFFTLLEPGNGKSQARGKAEGLGEGNGGGEEEA